MHRRTKISTQYVQIYNYQRERKGAQAHLLSLIDDHHVLRGAKELAVHELTRSRLLYSNWRRQLHAVNAAVLNVAHSAVLRVRVGLQI